MAPMQRDRVENVHPVAIPHPQTLSFKMTVECSGVRFIRDRLLNLGVKMIEWPASSPHLSPIEHLWDQPECAFCARASNTAMQADF